MEPRREGDGGAVEGRARRGEHVEPVEHLLEVAQVVVAGPVPRRQQVVAERVVVGQGPAVGEAHRWVASCSSRASAWPEAIAHRIVRVAAAPSTRLVTGGMGGSRSSRRASAGSNPMAAEASAR